MKQIRNFRTSADKHDNLDMRFRNEFKNLGWRETGIDTEESLYDKFGRPRDLVLEQYMGLMIRPRSLYGGVISNGERRAYQQLKQLRGGTLPYEGDPSLNGHLVPMDSLIESCFNSEENNKWADYRLEVGNPKVSECSQEKFFVLKSNSALEEETIGDPFSELQDSDESALSKGYSSVAGSQRDPFEDAYQFQLDHIKHGRKKGEPHYGPDYYQKFCYYKIYKGLKLPTLQGERDNQYTIKDLIDVSIAEV